MTFDKRTLLYDGAKAINCTFSDGVIVGEDSYAKECQFGKNVHINRRNFLQNTKFGDYTYTGHNTTIKYCSIGKYCSISWDVSIGGANHDYHHISTHPFSAFPSFGFVDGSEIGYQSYADEINIGNDVWVGSGVQILRGVTIGNGAIIGAGAVVTKGIPHYAIAVGNPAKVIKYRFSEDVITILEKLAWWDLDEGFIKSNIAFFKEDITIEKLTGLWQKSQYRREIK